MDICHFKGPKVLSGNDVISYINYKCACWDYYSEQMAPIGMAKEEGRDCH